MADRDDAHLKEVFIGTERILDGLASDDERAGRPARTVWFTGHSLGGAIATLAAYAYRDPGRTRLYTFGSGSAWNGELAEPVSDFPRIWLFSAFHAAIGNDVVYTITAP